MLVDDLGHGAAEVDRREDLMGDGRVRLDEVELVRREARGLGKDLGRATDLADVVDRAAVRSVSIASALQSSRSAMRQASHATRRSWLAV